MMDSLERRSSRPMSAMFTPSILIHPEFNSDNRNKHTPNELFPDPVLPTIPIFSLGSTSKLIPLRTSGKLGRYLILTLENVMEPNRGQSSDGRLPSTMASPSLSSVCKAVCIRWTEMKRVSVSVAKRTVYCRIPDSCDENASANPAYAAGT